VAYSKKRQETTVLAVMPSIAIQRTVLD